MKLTIIIASLLLLALVAIQYYTMSNTNDTERQPYRTLVSEKPFEIRFYPSATIASVTKKGDQQAMSSAGFRDLAGYIFGGNTENQKIAMTSPVIMEEKEANTTMSFVMPSEYEMKDLPLPNNSNVTFSKTEPVYMATVTFGGFSNAEKIQNSKSKLVEWLDQKGIKHQNKHVFYSYNPPYQLVGRRNEVAIQLIDFKE